MIARIGEFEQRACSWSYFFVRSFERDSPPARLRKCRGAYYCGHRAQNLVRGSFATFPPAYLRVCLGSRRQDRDSGRPAPDCHSLHSRQATFQRASTSRDDEYLSCQPCPHISPLCRLKNCSAVSCFACTLMIPPLPSIRVSRAYEPNSVAMANHQQVAGFRATNSHESALILRMVGIVPGDGRRVVKNGNGVVEKDAVLAEIARCFRVIPLKACRHAQRRSGVSRKVISIA
jgi:hypothetical protein